MWEYILDQIEANSGAQIPARSLPRRRSRHRGLARGGNVDIALGFFSRNSVAYLEGGKSPHWQSRRQDAWTSSSDMPTFNEAFGGNEYLWQLVRYAVVPKGTPSGPQGPSLPRRCKVR
mgnify:CR=1 FL=1